MDIDKLNSFLEISHEKRSQMSKKYLTENKKRIPILIKNNIKTLELGKIKYLIPNRYKVSNLLKKIKSSLKLDSKDSIFLSINKIMLNSNLDMMKVYEKYKADDGFLYVDVNLLHSFG